MWLFDRDKMTMSSFTVCPRDFFAFYLAGQLKDLL